MPKVDQAELTRQAGTRLGSLVDGKYRLLSVLGVGGMGAVFVAQHQYTDREVALKALHPGRARGPNAQRFLREAKAAAHIDHPRVAQVLDAGEDEAGDLYLVMERLHGDDLGRLIRERRAPPERLVEAARQVLEALEAAHARGVVHRDIKPANIFLCGGDDAEVDARLLDFGVARRLTPGAGRLTQAGAVVGTPYFMSPEQMCGEDVDGRADLWALGVVLFFGLTRALPYRAEGYVALLKEMLQAGPPSLATLQPGLDPGLCAAVHRALSPRIEDRFADAADMRAALGPAPPPPSPRPVAPRASAPATAAPATEAPAPAWAGALDAIEAEISSLESAPEPSPPAAKRPWWKRK